MVISRENHSKRPTNGDASEASGHDTCHASAIRCRWRAAGLPGWQYHGVFQRMKKTVLANPAPAFYQLSVHHGDLTGRAAETDETELEPI